MVLNISTEGISELLKERRGEERRGEERRGGGGVQTGSTRHAGHFWPIVSAPGDCEDGEFGGMKIGRGNSSKVKLSLYRPWRPLGLREVDAPTFLDIRLMVARLSALRAGRFLPPKKIAATHFCYRLSRHQGHSAAGRIR
jgi:hypothetical protein